LSSIGLPYQCTVIPGWLHNLGCHHLCSHAVSDDLTGSRQNDVAGVGAEDERIASGVFALRRRFLDGAGIGEECQDRALESLGLKNSRILLLLAPPTAVPAPTPPRLSTSAARVPCGSGNVIRHWTIVLLLRMPRGAACLGNAGSSSTWRPAPGTNRVRGNEVSEVLRGGQVCCLLAVEQHFRRGLLPPGMGPCETRIRLLTGLPASVFTALLARQGTARGRQGGACQETS